MVLQWCAVWCEAPTHPPCDCMHCMPCPLCVCPRCSHLGDPGGAPCGPQPARNWLACVQRQVVRTTDGKQEVEHLVGQYHILLQTAEDLRSITFSPVGAPAAAEPVCTVRAVKRGAMFRGMGDPHVGDYVFACTKGSNCVAFTPSDLFTMKASAIQNRLPIRLTLVRREAVTLGTLRDGGAVAVAIDIMEEEEMWAAELVEAEEKRRAYLREQRKAREAAKAARDTNAAASGPDPCCEDEG